MEKVSEKLKTIPGHNVPSVQNGTGALAQGQPSLYVFSTCVNTIHEFETYRWKEKSVSWVRFGIEKVAEKLKCIPGHTVHTVPQLSQHKESEHTGMPALFIFSTCINTIHEFETYRWKEKSVSQAQDLNKPDVPEKANDHALDALRYFAVSYKTNLGGQIDKQQYGQNYENINKDLAKKWRI